VQEGIGGPILSLLLIASCLTRVVSPMTHLMVTFRIAMRRRTLAATSRHCATMVNLLMGNGDRGAGSRRILSHSLGYGAAGAFAGASASSVHGAVMPSLMPYSAANQPL
jgi:hypothetical protein